MSAILAIDAGTTGVTALVVDADGRLLGRGYRELTSYFSNPGEVEHDPDEIVQVALGAACEGAAALAGLALGIWAKPADFLVGRRFTRFVPGPHAGTVRARQAEWQRAIDTALAWAAGSELDRAHRPARRPRRPCR